MVICLERGADLHMAQLMPLPLTVSCSSKIQIGFTFLVPAHRVVPGKGPLNGCTYVVMYACRNAQEVEPMGRESDHIHIATLTTATGVPVRVEYVDRGTTAATGGSHADDVEMRVNHHDFPDNSRPPSISLIYRPGHYDILYVV